MRRTELSYKVNDLEVTNPKGETKLWQYYRNNEKDVWLLKTDAGLVIELERNLVPSRLVIQTILKNYGLKGNI